MELTVVIPAYNERENLPNLVEQFRPILTELPVQLLIVDNGSDDGSAEYLRTIQDEQVKILILKKNRGYGGGILAGLAEADTPYVGYTHADLQVPPSSLLQAYNILSHHKDRKLLIKGIRKERPRLDSYISAAMAVMSSLLLRQKLYEVNAQPTIFSRELLAEVSAAPIDFTLDLYVLSKCKTLSYDVARFPVSFPSRMHGTSKWNKGLLSKPKMIKTVLATIQQLRKEAE